MQKLRLIFLFILLCNLLIFTTETTLYAEKQTIKTFENKVIKITSLNEIEKSQPAGTLYLFDIDDTLLDSAYMLGSKMWRKHIQEHTKRDQDVNWHDTLSLFVNRHYPFTVVEPITSQLIEDLKLNGHVVIALTARQRTAWYSTGVLGIDELTVDQLTKAGITFDTQFILSQYPFLKDVPEYFEGILFSEAEAKGGYLVSLFKEMSELPKKVVFVDDKEKQAASVCEAMETLGIPCESYWYTASDIKAKEFNALIANIQLYYLWISDGKEILSDEEALAIAAAENSSEKTALYYLDQVIELAKGSKRDLFLKGKLIKCQ